MYTGKNSIDKAYRNAHLLSVSSCSKIVIMSDCHRGIGNLADDFAKNRRIYYAALQSYYKARFTYIELGDGDELWENKSMTDIKAEYRDIFELLARFYKEKRLITVFGNHDIIKKFRPDLADAISPGMPVYESVVLKLEPMGGELLLLHGHQADFFNDRLWVVARFLVRHIWKPLELIGFSDPTSAAKNNKVTVKVEKNLTGWAEDNRIPLIAGHTHRPVFPESGKGIYFNDGCCVHPWSITALEIVQESIALVKWRRKTKEDGTVTIARDIIAGPKPLRSYIGA